jgi:anti-sigma regulatory factor (Ser/Thr protein kinase)
MATTTTAASEATVELAMMAGGTVLASLTVPGHREQVAGVRRFVRRMVGDASPMAETAALLASELATNAVLHSASGQPGGSATVLITEIGGGVRVEVADEGSAQSAPVVRGDIYASEGHGLFLVQSLADQWGYVRDETGTTVWFWLSYPAA